MDLTKNLETLGFTKTEALVYVTLVKHVQLNGSQVAKLTGMSRSTIYSALNNLYVKGHVVLASGETSTYLPKDPEVLIEQLKTEFTRSADALKEELSHFKVPGTPQEYYNIKGYSNFLLKTKEMLLKAEKEVLINSCYEPGLFKEELDIIAARGVRIILFTFADIDVNGLPLEFFHKSPIATTVAADNLRFMLVIDMKSSLIAGNYNGREMVGTFTENPLLTDIVSEHIHLDIYLLRLQRKLGTDKLFSDIQLNTLLEARSRP
ncbi:MAG: TrmB family transcriptional regulator [Spartobacteria bacterium]|nr:TrmB family transcriptional regulator [Spartobacteria bacterium]